MTLLFDPSLRPVLVGELLFDLFPAGQAVLGGAPFIVSSHLQRFGLNPLLISRVGADPLGEKIVSTLKSWGIDTQGIQIDPIHPTGSVQVSLQAGQPTFHILPDQAYDFIDPELALAVIRSQPVSLLYHGTLATRTDYSRQAIQILQQQTELPIFLDLNLRDPWWDRPWVEQILRTATWVKLNEFEFQVLVGAVPKSDWMLQVRTLQERLGCQGLLVTLGEEGALIALPDSILKMNTASVPVVDTVGAGDAFVAITLVGLHHQWDPDVILRRALAFASDICQISGGTTSDPSLYERHLQQWDTEGFKAC